MNPSRITNRIPNLRIELFFKNTDELRERVQFLSNKGVQSFNLVNKSNQDDIAQWAQIIREEIPDSDICMHYSLKYNKSRKKDGAFLLFKDFVDAHNLQCQNDGMDSNAISNDLGMKNEVLLINGSGPKGRFDSVAALEQLRDSSSSLLVDNNTKEKSSHHLSEGMTMAVAFNPFFPSPQEVKVEKDRLMSKLKTGQVQKIYLQFGTDLQRLRSCLQWLSQLQTHDKHKLEICGSIFLPTKKLIAQQKFRPWNGVFLTQEFLNSEQDAKGVVLYMMRLYKEFGCEILIEAPGVRNEKDMALVEQLLKERDDEGDSQAFTIDSMNGEKEAVTDTASTTSSATSIPSPKRRRTNNLIPSSQISKDLLLSPAILLFSSHDVRLHDNVALQLSSFHSHVIPVFLYSKKEQGKWGITGALEIVLKDALANLDSKLQNHGLKLICRACDDDTANELSKLCQELNARTVYLNKEHTTESRIREAHYKQTLEKDNIHLVQCQSSLLYDPTHVSLEPGFHGGHWGTLMPFLKACKKQVGEPRRPMQRYETLGLLDKMTGPDSWPSSCSIDELGLAVISGKDRWDEPILQRFPMSEDDALNNLNNFFRQGFYRYEQDRSRTDLDWSTSKLSAHLRLGVMSPNELYYKCEDSDLDYEDKKTFSRRLIWRDLAYFQLLHFPRMREYSIRSHYDDTEWISGEEEEQRFDAWKKGKTGYPLVDAGMRELYATGWMTQSVRMVVASFLTEYLRVNWVKGCEWFHYTLIDADSAINSMMWQNAGRSGIDQWNFVMSPVAASQDASGSYTKKWVPELSKLNKPLLHKPWDAPEAVLHNAGIVLGETYPERIITDLEAERRNSDANVLNMRRKSQEHNNNRGYDLVSVGGKQTVVFTKKQFRIDRSGNVIKPSKSKREGKKRQSNRRGRKILS